MVSLSTHEPSKSRTNPSIFSRSAESMPNQPTHDGVGLSRPPTPTQFIPERWRCESRGPRCVRGPRGRRGTGAAHVPPRLAV